MSRLPPDPSWQHNWLMITRLIDHLIWADRRTNDAIATVPAPDPGLLRLQSHLLGSQATWLARIKGEHAAIPIWPALDLAGCRSLAEQTHADLVSLLARLEDPAHPREVTYSNTRGETFTSTVDDILHHVAMHSMYHRGQVMLCVRQQGGDPSPTDFIAFARGH